MHGFRLASLCAAALASASAAVARNLPATQTPSAHAGHETPSCDVCAAWNVDQPPFRLYGNAYYVGVRGLSAVLITSDAGHVLIDGALPESASKVAANIRALGFRPEEVRLILNSHVHYDHAGGIAELQRLSSARVAASRASVKALEQGRSGTDDPQYGILPPIQAITKVSVFQDGDTLRVGQIAITAHLTPGHTPGGTSWTWKSCEGQRCLDMVYADSLTAVSAPTFKFSSNTTYPGVVKDFEKSFETVAALPCDILITPHPEASGLWERLERREKGGAPDALVDLEACKNYVSAARQRLVKRLAQERAD